MDKDKLYKDFFDAYITYCSYFGLVTEISLVKDFIFRSHENLKNKYVSIPVGFTFANDFIEQLWCILVLLYGSYGVSPKFGWIEDIDGAITFLEILEKMLSENSEE